MSPSFKKTIYDDLDILSPFDKIDTIEDLHKLDDDKWTLIGFKIKSRSYGIRNYIMRLLTFYPRSEITDNSEVTPSKAQKSIIFTLALLQDTNKCECP